MTKKRIPWNEGEIDDLIDYDDMDDEREPCDEYMDDEYCCDCGRPSHACENGLCPMCFELTGGIGHGW